MESSSDISIPVKSILLSGIVGCSLGLLYKKWSALELEHKELLPPKCPSSARLFAGFQFHASCNDGAQAVFLILTGYNIQHLQWVQSSLDNGCLDNCPVDDAVHYYTYLWEKPCNSVNRVTNKCHHLVYYRGYLYQSWSESYYSWTDFFSLSYPLVKMLITEKDVAEVFAHNPGKLTAEQFNEWCAPESSPIPHESELRLTRHYSAKIDPSLSLLEITVKNHSLKNQ